MYTVSARGLLPIQMILDEYQAGKFPCQIFEENGFDVGIIGIKRMEQSAYRWKKAYEKNGLIGLTDSRKTGSGRPLKRELTLAEIMERQKARIELLEGQVELLKKLEMTERRQNEFMGMTRYFCHLLGFSRSGYTAI